MATKIEVKTDCRKSNQEVGAVGRTATDSNPLFPHELPQIAEVFILGLLGEHVRIS